MGINFRVEDIVLMDGNNAQAIMVKCGRCGADVFVNTITKNPEEYDYFCTKCGTFIPQSVMDEIIAYLKEML